MEGSAIKNLSVLILKIIMILSNLKEDLHVNIQPGRVLSDFSPMSTSIEDMTILDINQFNDEQIKIKIFFKDTKDVDMTTSLTAKTEKGKGILRKLIEEKELYIGMPYDDFITKDHNINL